MVPMPCRESSPTFIVPKYKDDFKMEQYLCHESGPRLFEADAAYEALIDKIGTTGGNHE